MKVDMYTYFKANLTMMSLAYDQQTHKQSTFHVDLLTIFWKKLNKAVQLCHVSVASNKDLVKQIGINLPVVDLSLMKEFYLLISNL